MNKNKIVVYVAKNGVIKGYHYPYSKSIGFFLEKPKRGYFTNKEDQEWIGVLGMYIPSEFFPDMKWEDEPIKVEVYVKKIEE